MPLHRRGDALRFSLRTVANIKDGQILGRFFEDPWLSASDIWL